MVTTATAVKYWNAGERGKPVHTSVCAPCYEIRRSALKIG